MFDVLPGPGPEFGGVRGRGGMSAGGGRLCGLGVLTGMGIHSMHSGEMCRSRVSMIDGDDIRFGDGETIVQGEEERGARKGDVGGDEARRASTSSSPDDDEAEGEKNVGEKNEPEGRCGLGVRGATAETRSRFSVADGERNGELAALR